MREGTKVTKIELNIGSISGTKIRCMRGFFSIVGKWLWFITDMGKFFKNYGSRQNVLGCTFSYEEIV